MPNFFSLGLPLDSAQRTDHQDFHIASKEIDPLEPSLHGGAAKEVDPLDCSYHGSRF